MESISNNLSYNNYSRDNIATYIHHRPTWYWISISFVSIITTLGNSLVIFLITSKKTLRSRVSPNLFILSLGVADFLVGSFNIPALLLCRFAIRCGNVSLSIIYSFIPLFLTSATVNVCLLTFDVYLGVFHPFFYPNLMYPSRVRLLIAFAWLLSVILNIPTFITVWNEFDDKSAGFADQILTLIFSVLASGFLVFAYARILRVVRIHRQQIKKHETQLATNSLSFHSAISPSIASGQNEQVRRKYKDGTITATGFVTLIFLVCNGFWQYYLIHRIWPEAFPISYPLIYLIRLLVYCTSSMNFVVYALLRKDLREELESYVKKIYNKFAGKRITATTEQ
ncbi:probable G-protein coupled receptor No9 isoform X1 [Actinia tenebrosa]|uniref:Probable G-protein coupled receptor No9 isoform X1 n=1 Tax=Actinia tenebrosa TaxID=6105 RepID=A0A6P8GZN5_ACTTE|nr:probable G-protein coupled receptor No9 isoform X1 [Actinia tenebrosa]XP_031548556.1 probable G-protein coupled receptor No9 isoform X1 [Actinia tenebrosa]XP_031548557.1 probable G-protein coupled receptor No9 isoform X1 [Actinia tenebrosa]